MKQHNFRIFGLDTSFDSDHSTRGKVQAINLLSGIEKPTPVPPVIGPTTSKMRSFKIFNEDMIEETPVVQAPIVTIKLGDFAPMLVDAVSQNRVWLEDFGDDQIQVPQDLYELIVAYQNMKRAA